MMRRTWVDDRYTGLHGIARYAQEVVPRVDVPMTSLGLTGKPGAPKDALQKLPTHTNTDVVYSPGYAGFFSRTPQILTIHDLIHLHTPWPGRAKYMAYYSAVVRRAIRGSGVAITVSEASRNVIIEWVNDSSVTVVNAGNGCGDVFQPEGIRPDYDPYLLYVGNLRKHKNVETVLAAVARDSRLVIRVVIPKTEQDEARALAQRFGVGSHQLRFETAPGDSELAALYRGASATVMPSTLEGFGLPALESIRSGTPVIYWSGCEPIREIVGQRGIAVNAATSVDAWAEALNTAIETATTFDMTDTRDWTWSHVADTVSETLKEAAH